ncbi:brain-specific angiogenesis inhibitor 1-associated protein 2-like [Halichondria panicea]|uniref:brain-specific angiogenesis inhibitor 1-associated protein 2-like n=1 Tax=Halichondria panicea TaxID=6063 RepID=UPI00312BCAA6
METKSEQMHRLADTTYRNIGDVIGDLKSLSAAAKSYQKAMEGMVSASNHFFFIFESIGAKASKLPGAVHKLGDNIMEMVNAHEKISNHHHDWIQSLETDFIVPLGAKLDMESHNIPALHKSYKQEHSKQASVVDKTGSKLKSLQKKKSSREQIEKEAQLKQVLSDYTEELHAARAEGLRKALIEERKLYCFVVEHFCSVVHNQIAYNALSHQELSTKVTDWSTNCSSPNELPPESSILLADPQSPRAYPGSSNLDYDGGSDTVGILKRTDSKRSNGSHGSGGGKPRTRRISCRVKALYPNQVSTSGQLEFTPGDLIDALDDPHEGWQYGENTRTGGTGWFPVQFVDKIWPTPETARRKKRNDSLRSSSGQLTGGNIPERDYDSPISQRQGRDYR